VALQSDSGVVTSRISAEVHPDIIAELVATIAAAVSCRYGDMGFSRLMWNFAISMGRSPAGHWRSLLGRNSDTDLASAESKTL